MLTQEDHNHIRKIVKEAIEEIDKERDEQEEEANRQFRIEWLKSFIILMVALFIIGLILSI
ncbi:hypothetical protein ACT2CV_01250 [Pasteurellaceae bacterium 22721_9_1]